MRSYKICPVRNLVDSVRKLKFLGIADVGKFAVFHQHEIIFGRQIFQRKNRGIRIEIGNNVDMRFKSHDMRTHFFRKIQKFLRGNNVG